MWSEPSLEVSRGTKTVIQSHSHNALLQLLFWTGIIGLASYIAIYARAIIISYRHRYSAFGKTPFLLLAYFAIVQMFDVYSIISKPNQYWLCVWLPVGIAFGLTARKKPEEPFKNHPKYNNLSDKTNC
ncbi:hypothetical protein NBRC116495_26380 [Aurantivibrio plasticivorans]